MEKPWRVQGVKGGGKLGQWGGVQRPTTTGWRPCRSPLGVHVLLPKTATASPASVPRGGDAGPLPPAALVVPGHRPPSGCLALSVTGRHPR